MAERKRPLRERPRTARQRDQMLAEMREDLDALAAHLGVKLPSLDRIEREMSPTPPRHPSGTGA